MIKSKISIEVAGSMSEPKVEKIEYFMKDTRLFLLWKISREEFLSFEKEHFSIRDISFESYINTQKVFDDMWNEIDMDARFFVNIYSDSEAVTRLPQSASELTKHHPKDHKRIIEIMGNISRSDFTGTDLMFVSSVVPSSIFSEIYFTPKEGAEQRDDELRGELDQYIKVFINGELLIKDVNYFNFKKQTTLFIKLVRDMKAFEEYGRNFIVSNGSVLRPFYHDQNSLFIHTIYALELLGYIKVLSINFSGHSFNDTVYSINIMPNDSFRALIYEDYRKKIQKI